MHDGYEVSSEERDTEQIREGNEWWVKKVATENGGYNAS
jgi:hypothetical protein